MTTTVKLETRKQSHNALVRTRLETALRHLYHNARISFPGDLRGRDDDYFQSWLADICAQEIDYIGTGGAYGTNYSTTLAAPCNAGRYQSEAARRYYVRKGLASRRATYRAGCGALTGWGVMELAAGNQRLARKLRTTFKTPLASLRRNDGLWECITDYGTLYQWGRGGATLAPDGLYSDRRGKADPAEMSVPACVELIRVLESFNRYVRAWCASVPEQWADHCAEEDREAAAARRRSITRKAKETRERNYWACRDVITWGAQT